MNQDQIEKETRVNIASPCVRICKFDDITGRCIGCQRSRDEVLNWFKLTPAQKEAVVADLPERTRQFQERRDAPSQSIEEPG